ncbi:aquaporin [uncultured Bifidobacterium sp.]|uniref:MIP/aquaporin family protein n=1 Tax=uncultured Bifidobacterium sp. TaxID=165187 RepID=UPI00262D89CB|nr:aquaporin [uncultured Bifidobacterium sp.]
MNNCISKGQRVVSYPLGLRIAAEFVSSLVVCFAIYAISTLGTAMYGVNMAFIAVATGLAYMAAIVVFGRVSGAQVNPAVTITAMLVGRTGLVDGITYIVAQIVGAIAAGAAIVKLLPTSSTLTAKIWLTPAVNGFDNGSVSYSTLSSVSVTFSIVLAVVVELVGALIVVSAVVRSMDDDGRICPSRAGGVAVAYGLAAAITYPVTGTGLNPARSTGIAIFAQNHSLSQEPLQQLWVFWVCPVLAAAIVALVMIVSQILLKNQAASPTIAGLAGADAYEGDVASGSAVEPDGDVQDDEADGQSDSDDGVKAN